MADFIAREKAAYPDLANKYQYLKDLQSRKYASRAFFHAVRMPLLPVLTGGSSCVVQAVP
jgi:hypothetical protein